jgi:integrase/recombinase XerD
VYRQKRRKRILQEGKKMPTSTEEWITCLEQEGKSPATVKAYRAGIEHFGRWLTTSYGEAFDPATVVVRDVSDWIAHQQTVQKAAPATINRRLAAVSQFFKWALAEGNVSRDPTAGVEGLRRDRRRPKALEPGDLRKLLRAVHRSGNLRDIALLELLVGTGLRASEVTALTAADLALGPRSGEVTVRRGKGGVQRSVPLTAEVRRALNDYLDQHPRRGDEPLWVGQRGPLQDPAAVWRIVKKYAFQAGLDEEVSPHTCRHSFATRYLEANPGDLRGLAALLGHASLETVMIYTEPTTEQLLARMEQAERRSGG